VLPDTASLLFNPATRLPNNEPVIRKPLLDLPKTAAVIRKTSLNLPVTELFSTDIASMFADIETMSVIRI
jgi:hypothetical protein